MSRRRIKLFAGTGLALASIALFVSPEVAEWQVRRELADLGFPDARVEVASLGVDHLALRDVHLADGIDIGSIELDRGLSLLWKELNEVTIRTARVTPAAAARVASTLRRSAAKPRAPVHLDVDVIVRDPSRTGWSAHGQGRLVWSSELELERGRVDLTVTRTQLGNVEIENGSIVANVEGNLTSLDLRGDATVRAARLIGGPLTATDVALPVTFESSAAHVRGGQATAMGGALSIDGRVSIDGSADVTIAANGLRLDDMLKPTRRLSGTGLIDGSVHLVRSAAGWTLTSGELHARDAGTVHVTDRAWRERVVAARAPLAVHAAIGEALLDFQYDSLTASLGDEQLQVAIRGRGTRNHQALDITVGVHDLRGDP
jgi:hypothetical protein